MNKNLQKFSLSLPDTFKLSHGYTKYILRKAFGELSNKLLFRKDKEGFDTGKDYFLKKIKPFLERILSIKIL